MFQVPLAVSLRPSFPVLPRRVFFAGRLGVLHVQQVENGWGWRVKGRHRGLIGPVPSITDALVQSAEAYGLTADAAAWKRVRS